MMCYEAKWTEFLKDCEFQKSPFVKLDPLLVPRVLSWLRAMSRDGFNLVTFKMSPYARLPDSLSVTRVTFIKLLHRQINSFLILIMIFLFKCDRGHVMRTGI